MGAVEVVLVETTERKRAEEALRESEARFRILADAMPQIVCVLGVDGTAEYVNPEWTAFSGLDLAATQRAGWERVLHPDDHASALACRRRALKTLAAQDAEARYRGANGTFRWYLCRLAPIVEGGRVVRFVGAAMSIDDRKRAEAEVRSLAQFPTENPNPVLRASTDGRVLYANGPAEMMLDRMGWREGDPLPESLLQGVRRVPVVGTITQHEVTTPEGRVWSFTLSASAGEGHVNLFAYDVTKQRQAEQALRDADRRKDEFLGMLSHELRNPLAPIRNSLYILGRTEPNGEQACRAREVAGRQVAHITRLVDDLLDVTRIARGKIEVRRADFDLAALAMRTAEDYRAMMSDRMLTLDVDVPAAPVIVNGDETRLAQVLGNLLSNAAKFTPTGGRVSLTVEAEADRAVVHVRDSGPGISPEMLTSLFEPFTQAKQTLARTEGGLGLGLSLVKGLVQVHGGEVTVVSRQGSGADFVVRLPLASAPAPSARQVGSGITAQPMGAHRRRVLVVDDNRDAAESLGELVRMLGHDVDLAFDGPSALAQARQLRPDLVLCDIGLPGMDGYEVARALRAAYDGSVRLVALSGYAQPEDVARALDAGFDKHVAKPPDPAKLERLVA